MAAQDHLDPERAIAIVGMAGRFPGAADLDAFWQMLIAGREGITRFTDEQLLAAGVDPAELRDAAYVKANGVLDGIELFDASFFGFTPLEAEITDPQHRLFLETAWQALEDAGYHAQGFDGRIGVFAGAGLSTYLIHHLLPRPDVLARVGAVQLSIANNKDYVPTRVSYKLDLKGPSVSVNTACSSSLVAVHLACQSLLDYHADMVLAGGVGIQVPQDVGYRYVPSGIASPDGHCRPFDARAQGTVSGNGVGVVVLRRLSDALADGDSIRAVILGSAVNNDGAAKVGYTAPSVTGQSEVIAEALAVADVEPDTIQYVEAHGTATVVGDPIEVTALTQAFRMKTDRSGFCAIGSVKSNVGHLDEAAGVAGLIKTVLALQHGELPPSLHYEAPNPEIDFASSPFYVNATARRWPGDRRRRAGVSSFGIGGTNAHVVLEEAPEVPALPPVDAAQVLTLSAKTPAALDQRCRDLAAHLRKHPELRLADVAWTLQQGRRSFEHRLAIVAADVQSAAARLEAAAHSRTLAPSHRARVAFLLPGQGAQYPGMGRGLYDAEPVYRDAIDRCATLLIPELGVDIRQLLWNGDAVALTETSIAQCVVFATDYAVAKLWSSWGVEPDLMLGHSLGELVAATLAGVFTLKDTLRLVAVRGRLMQALPRGAMLAVPLSESELSTLLDDGVSIAAVNGPSRCVASGSIEAIERLQQRLAGRGIESRRLETSHAFHSAAMDPVLDEFAALVSRVERRAPSRPWMSNVTGRPITDAEAVDPAYWASHIRRPVRFMEAAAALLADPAVVFLEAGPGRSLSSFVRQQRGFAQDRVLVTSLRHAEQAVRDDECIAAAVGQLWCAGVSINWRGVHRGEPRRRVPLPTYPFERQRYWIDPPRGAVKAALPPTLEKRPDVADWFYVPSWRRTARPAAQRAAGEWLVLQDGSGIAASVAQALREAGHESVELTTGTALIAEAVRRASTSPLRIVDCSMLGSEASGSTDPIAGALELARNVAAAARPVELLVVVDGADDVTGDEPLVPEKASATALLMVLAQERAGVTVRCIDVTGWARQGAATLASMLLDELTGGTEPVVAWRNGYRLVKEFEQASLPAARTSLRRGGAYLITGGLGGVGLILAEHLATRYNAKLALVGRSARAVEAALASGESADAGEARKREELVGRAVAEAAKALAVRGIDAYPDLERTIDRLCASYALSLAAKAGFDIAPGAVFEVDAFKRGLRVVPSLERMCEYLATVLADEKLVEPRDGRLVFTAAAAAMPQPVELHRDAVSRYPEFAGTFDLLEYCVRHYPEALSGAVPAISVLYPNGEPELLERAAARTVAHSTRDIYVRAVRDLLASIAASTPGRRLRVLEVGVGDGILAGVVAPALAGCDVEYWATDIGRSFVSRAEEMAKAAGLSHVMRFGTLDISRDPAEQGFAPGSFDVVLALDVLHATPDLRETLDNVGRLLAPGGTAAIIETVRPPRWVHFIWGLAEGWWAFRDPLRRHVSPLLPIDDWTAAFRDRGFAHVATWPAAGQEGGDYGLIVAQNTGVAGGHAAKTVQELRAAGSHVLLLEADVADERAMAAAVDEARRTFGRLDGVVHAAGETRREVLINAIEDTGDDKLAAVLRPKVAGTQSLAKALDGVPLDFVLLLSSNASVLGGLGLSAYAAASRYLDAFAAARRRDGDLRWISSNWDGWPTEAAGGFDSRFRTSIDRFAMTLDESRQAFERVVSSGLPQVVVSSGDLRERRRRWIESPVTADETSGKPAAAGAPAAHARPDVRTAFAPPQTAVERELARIWTELLGIDPIGIDDVFSELGGDSLLGTQLIARVERSLGCRLPFRALFEAPTVRQQAALIESATSPAENDDGIPVVEEQPTYPLSHAQRRLWILSQLDGSAAYNVPLHQQLDGELDRVALELALNRLAERHETLRTRIITIDGEPRQCIDPPAPVPLPLIDLSALPDPETAALEMARQDAATPFDLERTPGLRASLLRLAFDRHVLLLTMHHIACDGVSIAVLARDLAECYRAVRRGEAPQLPPLRIQYKDFAAWQQSLLDSGKLDADREYWLRQLGAPNTGREPAPPLELPTDRPRPSVQTFRGSEWRAHLSPERAASIVAAAHAHQVSLFMLLTAAVKILLHRYTGQRDIVVGTPVAGRVHPDLEGQVGFYLNMLALRNSIEPRQTVADLLRTVRETASSAFDHQAYPFDRLVDELDLARDLSRSPVFDVIVILQNQQESELTLEGLAVKPCFDHNGTSKADLTFNFKESTLGLAVGIEFNTDLFGDERVGRMGMQLLRVLEEIVRDPSQQVGAVDIRSADDRADVDEANATARPYPKDRTVIELVREVAAKTPDRVACICGSTALTYREVEERSAAVAAMLAARGVARGDRVGIHLERSADLVPALLGVLRRGAAYVPLDPAFPDDRLRLMAEDAGASVVITADVLANLPPATGDVTALPAPNDLAYVIYTSGSTGRPKGVAIEHRSLVNFLCSMAQEPGLHADDTLLAVTTLSFDIAGLELFLPLVTGARVVIASREQAVDGRLLQEALRASGATVMQATPASWQMLIESGWQGDPNLTVLCGGEALPRELADWLASRCRRVWNLYGPTETTVWSSVLQVPRAADGDREESSASAAAVVPIGRPIANTALYVLDEWLQEQPAGVPGELYIGGDGLARGYMNLPVLTAERFVPDPFAAIPGARMYRTGDRAVRRFDGTLEFLGRADDQIKLRGFRIEIGEIENALLAHPRVARAAVVLDQAATGPRLVAGVVLQPGNAGGDETIGELRQHLRALLPEYMVPAAYVFLDDLPRTLNGKVDRKALRALASSAAVVATGAAPSTPLERQIAAVWAEVLGVESIGVDVDFFQAGGHSLAAARLAFRLGETVGVRLTLMDIFQHPTVAALARLVSAREAAGETVASAEQAIPIAPLTQDELDMLND